MHRALRRLVTTTGVTAGTLAVLATPALAHYCTVESVQGKAGEAYALFGEGEDPVAIGGIRVVDGKIVGGGMVDLWFDADGTGTLSAGDVKFADNMLIKAGLPVQSLTAAGCGKGVGTAFPEEFGLPAC